MSNPVINSNRLNRRWELLAAAIAVNTCLGTVYSWSVFRVPLEAAYAIASAQSAIPYSVFLAVFAFSMPLGGALIARLGTVLVLFVGGAIVGLGWILAGVSDQLLGLTLTYGVVGGLGVGLAYGVPLAVAGSWFPAHRGLAMGLALAGFGVSPFVTAPIAESLIRSMGVNSAMIVLGVSFIVIVGALAPFLRRYVEPSTPDSEPDTVAHEREQSELTPSQMLRTGRFYAFWLCYMIGTLSGLTAIGMTATFGQIDAGLTPVEAAFAVSLFGILNGVGRPIFGALHDRLGTRWTVVVASALVALAAAVSLFVSAESPFAFYLGFGLFWLMLGGWLAIAPAATTRLFGAKHYASNYGLMYTAYGVGALAGGLLSGRLFALSGSHASLFTAVLILCGAGIVVAIAGVPDRTPSQL
ncbi:MAG: OFA family MFS transporter [Spirochaetales bacterium]